MNLFSTYRPCPALQDMVEMYWHTHCDLTQSLVQEMYTPSLQALTFNMSGWYEDVIFEDGHLRMNKCSYVIGQPLTKRMSISNPQGINILGVKFTPLGLSLLTAIDMQHIANQIIDATDIWGADIALLYEKMLAKNSVAEQLSELEMFLIAKRKKQNACARMQLVANTIQRMEQHRTFAVAQLLNTCPVTKKTLERYFLNQIGLSPKQYASIARFNKMLTWLDAQLTEPHWHQLIVDFGYYDQSHLIKDFKRFTGKTPTEYFSAKANAAIQVSITGLKQLFN